MRSILITGIAWVAFVGVANAELRNVSNFTGVSAAVVYYGGQIVKFADEKPKCPVQMHFGETDASIPMSDVEIIKQKRKDCQIFTYPAGHGFYCDERASFNDASAKLAWQRTLDFLAKNLK